MSKLVSYLVFLAWISYLLTSGLLIFIDGFFLSRVARPERSDCVLCESQNSCDSREIFLRHPQDAAEICPKPRSRVVLLVIDALKYEFLEWHEDAAAVSSHHRNKLLKVREMLREHPRNSRLYRFVADPPTTTMQRLKGLTTGTLPTFIDVGSNFATESVEEDNLVDQAAKRGRVVFMGDDTWTQLFPQKFLRQFPSPSFNVWDLDTVDREVRSRVGFELKKSDWSLLIAHTLGVDHCGHKHGQRHPEMARKLGDADRLIGEIIEAMGDDTILFVVGDHGMTESGDHGGDSEDEVEAGMFVYSKNPLVEGGGREDGSNRVNQIDLVPTLAAALGIPIPFSNIGTVIVDSLPASNASVTDRWFTAHAIWRNVVQTKKYVDAYSSDSFLFTEEKLQQINEMFDQLREQIDRLGDARSFDKFASDSRAFLKLIRDLCAEIWVQFDASSMSKGLLLVFCSLFFLYLLINNVPEERMNKIMESHFLRFAVTSNAATTATVYALYAAGQLDEFKKPNFFATGVLSLSLLVILVLQNWDAISSTWYNRVNRATLDYATRGILLLSFCALFSNSFVVEEDRVLSFLVVTMIALLLFSAAADPDNSPYDDPKIKSKSGKNSLNPRRRRGLLILIAVVACAAVRLSSHFWRCREEQNRGGCGNFAGKSGSSSPEGAERILLTGSLILLALYITIVRIWLRNCGNLSGFSLSVTVARYCPGVIVVCVGCFWVLQRLPKDAKVKLAVSWQVNALPGIAYFFIFLGILVLFLKPLGVYLVPRRSESISVYEGEDIVPRLFDRVKELFYTKRTKEEPEVPVVYGLGTVYSAAFVSLSVFVTLLWSLLLGNVLAPGTFVMFVTCTAVLGLVAVERFRNATSVAELLQIPSSAILCWFFIAEYFFYGTGHQPTFPTIHWDAAFIGTGGHFYGNLLPAILIGINTFGGHLIMALTLPLLAIAPFTVYVMMPELAKLKFRVDDEMRKGELVLFERDSTYHNALFSIYGKYILLHGIRTFGCMMTATIHCRHLMVWKIFAPKLIFEGLSFLVTLGSVLASAFMVLRIDRQVDNLISRVTKIR